MLSSLHTLSHLFLRTVWSVIEKGNQKPTHGGFVDLGFRDCAREKNPVNPDTGWKAVQ